MFEIMCRISNIPNTSGIYLLGRYIKPSFRRKFVGALVFVISITAVKSISPVLKAKIWLFLYVECMLSTISLRMSYLPVLQDPCLLFRRSTLQLRGHSSQDVSSCLYKNMWTNKIGTPIQNVPTHLFIIHNRQEIKITRLWINAQYLLKVSMSE